MQRVLCCLMPPICIYFVWCVSTLCFFAIHVSNGKSAEWFDGSEPTPQPYTHHIYTNILLKSGICAFIPWHNIIIPTVRYVTKAHARFDTQYRIYFKFKILEGKKICRPYWWLSFKSQNYFRHYWSMFIRRLGRVVCGETANKTQFTTYFQMAYITHGWCTLHRYEHPASHHGELAI